MFWTPSRKNFRKYFINWRNIVFVSFGQIPMCNYDFSIASLQFTILCAFDIFYRGCNQKSTIFIKKKTFCVIKYNSVCFYREKKNFLWCPLEHASPKKNCVLAKFIIINIMSGTWFICQPNIYSSLLIVNK